MPSRAFGERFERTVLRDIDSGLNLAIWLVGNRHDAEDALQVAAIKAYEAFGRFRGTDSKAWFLAIVRNECMNSLRRRNQMRHRELRFDEGIDMIETPASSPAEAFQLRCERAAIEAAIDELPPAQREVVLLREVEELSYQQIASVVGIPVGTVMSRLSRARSALINVLAVEERAL